MKKLVILLALLLPEIPVLAEGKDDVNFLKKQVRYIDQNVNTFMEQLTFRSIFSYSVQIVLANNKDVDKATKSFITCFYTELKAKKICNGNAIVFDEHKRTEDCIKMAQSCGNASLIDSGLVSQHEFSELSEKYKLSTSEIFDSFKKRFLGVEK